VLKYAKARNIEVGAQWPESTWPAKRYGGSRNFGLWFCYFGVLVPKIRSEFSQAKSSAMKKWPCLAVVHQSKGRVSDFSANGMTGGPRD
jgi:hypothetical protein